MRFPRPRAAVGTVVERTAVFAVAADQSFHSSDADVNIFDALDIAGTTALGTAQRIIK
jgi:hypothetical protein